MRVLWISVVCCLSKVLSQYSTNFVQTTALSEPYFSIASSSSGQYLAAVAFTSSGGGIFTSSNYGYEWIQTSAPTNSFWVSIASSSSGQYLVAAQYDGGIFTSSDFGANWAVTSAQDSSSTLWVSVTSDSTGQFLAAAQYNNGIWTSSNFGVDWTQSCNCYLTWQAVTSSSNGQYIVAAISGGTIFMSSEYGDNFGSTNAPSMAWSGIAADASGQNIVATVNGGGIYTSNDYGQNWNMTSAPSPMAWTSVSSDESGQCLFAVISNGIIYYSLNNGVSWEQADSPNEDWLFVASSSDCKYVVAVAYGAGIYANLYSPTSVPTSIPTSPSSSPSVVPTSSPSRQPTSQPSSAPSAPPSSQPSSQPSRCPTSSPTDTPSTQPTTSPTSYPTYTSSAFDVEYTVQSTTAKSSYTFSGIGCDSIAYLSAFVEVSYLDVASGAFINITAGSGDSAIVVAGECAPASSCGSASCAVNIDVSTALSCQSGGMLTIYADTVNSQDATGALTLCSYDGTNHLQYALTYTLSAAPIPTGIPTLAPTLSSNTPFIFQPSPNAPFYVIVAISLLYIALGVILVRLRDKSPTSFVEISLLVTCYDLALIGYHMASEIFYIMVLFSKGLFTLAMLIIFNRIFSVLPALYFVLVTLGPAKYSQNYSKLLNQTFLFKNAPTFSVVILLMMFEQSMIRYFPWNASQYTKLSRGFPDQHLFQVCMVTKLLQLMVTLIVQIVVLAAADAILYGDSSSIETALVVMYLVSSILLFVVFTLVNVIRMGVREEPKCSDKVSIEEGGLSNPMHSVDGRGAGTELVQSLRGADVDEAYKARVDHLEERERQLTAELLMLKEAVQQLQFQQQQHT